MFQCPLASRIRNPGPIIEKHEADSRAQSRIWADLNNYVNLQIFPYILFNLFEYVLTGQSYYLQ